MSKSVLLGSVALFAVAFAGTASAQSSSAPILNNSPTANEAIVIQRGGGNTSTVDQTGATNGKVGKLNNTIDLTADNITAANGNMAFTMANSVVQYGNSNDLNIYQAGNNNTVSSSSGNYNNETFDFNPAAGGSFQRGDYNRVAVSQGGDNGIAQFQQNGNGNYGSIITDQGAKNTYAGLFQFGSSNEARIHQHDQANNAYAVVVQRGSNNKGSIDQYGTTNYAALLQVGDYNSAGIVQGGTAGVGAGGYQNGVGNSASVTQNGGLASNALFAQNGNGNSVTIRQK
ncbi:hypothetical protein [Methylobacterium sp. 17Sr1-1]|uniref:hypothetical protein n=1 Tax=Methylobacterium sp. 17Sr1-1 TaxID=2202826 RepID=UPI000D701031|nr:hypothetical protein [Methylobacterium sp. 17Sr1-1]AWN50452.1 hypothetical protein DK412_00835 [Methylobacterium sp. 17Sr1-1]